MPSPQVSKPLFPNVPNLPGVPALPRSPNFPPVIAAALGFGEGILWQMLQQSPKWGIYDQNNNAIGNPDSCLSVSVKADSRVSDFPVEDGAFASYNKVQMPNLPVVRMTKGGTVADRAVFLAAIDQLKKSTALISVITPEITYLNYTIESYDYQRQASDTAGLMVIDIKLKEIRQVTTQYSLVTFAKNPAANSQQNSGQVQAQAVPPSIFSQIGDFGAGLIGRLY